MTTTRIHWADLPDSVHRAVAARLGMPVLAAETASAGFNSEIAAKLTTSTGAVFVKGMQLSHPRVWTQRREAEINPYVEGLAPALLWHLEVDDWSLVAFEHVEARHADYRQAGDLELMVDALSRLGRTPCPPIELRRAEQRWAAYVDDPGMLARFAGNSLLHTDLNNENVLIQRGRALLVDWAWATRGAPWIDAALWVIWLIAAGDHSPAEAEAWAARLPAWRLGDPTVVDVFAQAQARMWADIAGDDPDPWTADLNQAAQQWARFRGSR
ncbi:aminoglycoside phosphotransferase [Streptomyces sp. FH025]|uniref:aminoglycoside phosphotransferase n=1 Tax=Streptomyces sp. FH025 TaxID=2815937 RepID=UPI001A9CD711|nr:aminoglycoside phosphotransferase [Streptomyces sp. FH025]MBO1413507.1 aminoglycoside phosphotransferase [Streptomyces sp. FH025]